MSAILGLMLGLGLLLIWQSGFPTRGGKKSLTSVSRLRRTMDRAGLQHVTTVTFLLISGCTVVVATGIYLLVTSTLTVSLVLAGITAVLPSWWLRHKADQRSKALRETWPDVVDHLRSAVRAGLPLNEALAQMSFEGPKELQPAFRAYAADLKVTANMEETLDRLAQRLADPVADRIISAVKLTREVGGADVSVMLTTLSGFLRTDARTRGELEARQSWTVNAARLAICAPWVILLVLCLEPRVAQAYSTPVGLMVLLGGALVAVVSYRIMMRIARLPEPQRVIA
ncbi:hypothetical protein HMPREF3160_00375 [Arthrobacter sp. HMSC06H05]|uniref:type II secretion system F family protein n=1 Tax=Arthrobacter sp. HMSC06H05 TaxID=1581128 RepID=UPI0008A1FA78|nr:type II secretion system F family protein [Arthrobacter sp. HMSC06H05]OFT44598.1 hypothetical protein HMPREF3160_00375 [Arthrobacter sp. HMSC06H05]